MCGGFLHKVVITRLCSAVCEFLDWEVLGREGGREGEREREGGEGRKRKG